MHIPILLSEIKNFLPDMPNCKGGIFLDATAGGGGHFFEILNSRKSWRGICWDQDSQAEERILTRAKEFSLESRVQFEKKNFRTHADEKINFNFILADLGVSSFQLDDINRGMSIKSTSPVDFKMDSKNGEGFSEWLSKKTISELEEILLTYGEEPKYKKIAKLLKEEGASLSQNSGAFAEAIKNALGYKASRIHPATRTYQALRIAINDELGALKDFLLWAPNALQSGGRIAILTFHSLEDALVKHRFKNLASSDTFDILTKRPITPSLNEIGQNPRSRSAKLRVLEKL